MANYIRLFLFGVIALMLPSICFAEEQNFDNNTQSLHPKQVAPNIILEFFRVDSSPTDKKPGLSRIGGSLLMSSTPITPEVSIGMNLPIQSDNNYLVVFGFNLKCAQNAEEEISKLEETKVGIFSYQIDNSKVIVEKWPYIGMSLDNNTRYVGTIMPEFTTSNRDIYDAYVRKSKQFIARLEKGETMLVKIQLENGLEGECSFDLSNFNKGITELISALSQLNKIKQDSNVEDSK